MLPEKVGSVAQRAVAKENQPRSESPEGSEQINEIKFPPQKYKNSIIGPKQAKNGGASQTIGQKPPKQQFVPGVEGRRPQKRPIRITFAHNTYRIFDFLYYL